MEVFRVQPWGKTVFKMLKTSLNIHRAGAKRPLTRPCQCPFHFSAFQCVFYKGRRTETGGDTPVSPPISFWPKYCDSALNSRLFFTVTNTSLAFMVFKKVVALQGGFPMEQESPHLDIPRLRYGQNTEQWQIWTKSVSLDEFDPFGFLFKL